MSETTALAGTDNISTSPMRLLEMAVDKGAGIDVVERLAKLQREMLDYQAKIEYNESMQRAQMKMKRVGADASNPQTHSKYATYAKLDGALRPIYNEEGFSLSFNTADSPLPENVRVLCDVSRGGYTKQYQVDMPCDGKGAKGNDVMTKTHAVGSAVAYGMRYLLKMIFNVSVGETDDDGNLGVNEETAKQRQSLIEGIERARGMDELTAQYQVAMKAGIKAHDYDGMKLFEKVYNAKKQEIENAQ